jgi:hypothetical protein
MTPGSNQRFDRAETIVAGVHLSSRANGYVGTRCRLAGCSMS